MAKLLGSPNIIERLDMVAGERKRYGKLTHKRLIPALWTGSLVIIAAFSLVLSLDVFGEILFTADSENLSSMKYWELTRIDLLIWLIRIVFLVGISFGAGLYLQGFYLKYDSDEALLLFLWLIGITFVPWRLLNLKMDILELQTWGVFLSRVFVFFEVSGFMFLSLASVVFANRHIQKIGGMTGAVLIFSFLVAYQYPINSFWLTKRLMLGWAMTPLLPYTAWILNFAGVLSIYLYLYFRKSIREALTMGIASIFLYSGWILLNFFNYYTAVIAGGLFLALGIWLYIVGISRYYAPWQ